MSVSRSTDDRLGRSDEQLVQRNFVAPGGPLWVEVGVLTMAEAFRRLRGPLSKEELPVAVPNPFIQYLAQFNQYRKLMVDQLQRVVIGQTDVIEQILAAIFTRGHCLLVGVPGLAKTLMIRTLADALNLSFSRIQFTPDLMPSDITGTEVLQADKVTGQRAFKFLHGP